MTTKPLNVHIYGSPFCYESRILKQTKALSEIFDEIVIVAINDGKPEHEQIDKNRRVWRTRILSKWPGRSKISKIYKILEWSTKVFFWSLRKKISHISCHSLSVLPLGLLLKLCKRSKLIYETHELETEVNGLQGVIKKVAKLVERICIRYVDLVVVVSPSIADWYKETYQHLSLKIIVVRNIPEVTPPASDKRYFRDHFALAPDAIVFLYLGMLIRGRGLEILIEAFSQLDNKYQLVMIGYGPLQDEYTTRSAPYANVHVMDAVPPEEVAKVATHADVGISLIENICLSYDFCLPNKVYEFMAAGLPILVSDCFEMKRLVETHQCGWVVNDNVEAVVEKLSTLEHNEIITQAHNAADYAKTLSWANEATLLVQAYRSLI